MVVVVLGHRLSTPELHPEFRKRVETGVAAFRETTARYLVCSGGRTNDTVPRAECDVMRGYAIDQGLDPNRVLVDDRSLDTIGNAYFTRLLIDDLTYSPETITVVTSAYHAERAAYIFRHCFGDGYRIETAFAAETHTPENSVREDRRFDQAREFFDPVAPGDVDAIRRRLIETHDLYELLAGAPTQ